LRDSLLSGSSADYSVRASNIQPAIGDPVVLYCKIAKPTGFTVQWRRWPSTTGTAVLIAQTTIKQACTIVLGAEKYQWDLCNSPSSTSTNYNLKIQKAEEEDSAYWDCLDIGKGDPSTLLHLQVKGETDCEINGESASDDVASGVTKGCHDITFPLLT
jgi:hypothetical protein